MLLIDSATKDLTPWLKAFKKHLPEKEVITYDEITDPSLVEVAVVWQHRKELFSELSKLKLVASLGAGVDHILQDPLLKPQVPVSKIVSPLLSTPMSNYCIGAILYYHKQFDKYALDKADKIWDQQFDPERKVTIGILGLGQLGTDLAEKLHLLGFDVHGLSQTKKNLKYATTYGANELETFLSKVNVLVCMLPRTKETTGIINHELLYQLPPRSFLINVGRGPQQVNQDIITALDEGQLSGAFLDVFPEEPLPSNSPLWMHPNVFITPHIAVVTKMEAAVPQIVENYQRLKEGKGLINLIDRSKGY
ncbi:MAG: glyoxylate/hydroxypyruvate reductase A [Bacteroidota bacterium]